MSTLVERKPLRERQLRDMEHVAALLEQASDDDLEVVWSAMQETLIDLCKRFSSDALVARIVWSLKDLVNDEHDHRWETLEAAEADLNGGHLTAVWEDEGFGFTAWCWCQGIGGERLYPTVDDAKRVARAHWPIEPKNRDEEL